MRQVFELLASLQQQDGQITDFISYYHLSSTVMNHPEHKVLNACYMYYHAASQTPLVDLVHDCVIQAHNVSQHNKKYSLQLNSIEWIRCLQRSGLDG
jgi:hypothetical protein